MFNGTIVGNITTCLVCLSLGNSWVLHDNGVQDCWTECDDLDRMISCTKPGQPCGVFHCISSPQPDIYDFVEVCVSILVGLILHALFLWVQDKLAGFMRNHEDDGGFSRYFYNALFIACCRGRFGRYADQIPFLRHADDLEQQQALPPGQVVPAIQQPRQLAAIELPPQPLLLDASAQELQRIINQREQNQASTSSASQASATAAPVASEHQPLLPLSPRRNSSVTAATIASSAKSKIPVSTPVTQPAPRQAAIKSESQTKKLFKDGRA